MSQISWGGGPNLSRGYEIRVLREHDCISFSRGIENFSVFGTRKRQIANMNGLNTEISDDPRRELWRDMLVQPQLQAAMTG
jgi:hypothetical protein